MGQHAVWPDRSAFGFLAVSVGPQAVFLGNKGSWGLGQAVPLETGKSKECSVTLERFVLSLSS